MVRAKLSSPKDLFDFRLVVFATDYFLSFPPFCFSVVIPNYGVGYLLPLCVVAQYAGLVSELPD